MFFESIKYLMDYFSVVLMIVCGGDQDIVHIYNDLISEYQVVE